MFGALGALGGSGGFTGSSGAATGPISTGPVHGGHFVKVEGGVWVGLLVLVLAVVLLLRK